MKHIIVLALLLLGPLAAYAQPGRLTPQGGTITGVTAGTGLTGGGTGGNVTVNVVCGTGLSCAADLVSIDPASVMTGVLGSGIVPMSNGSATWVASSMTSTASAVTITGTSGGRLTMKSTNAANNGSNVIWQKSTGSTLFSLGVDYNGNAHNDWWLYDNVNGVNPIYIDNPGISYYQAGTGSAVGGMAYNGSTNVLTLYANGVTGLTMSNTGDITAGDDVFVNDTLETGFATGDSGLAILRGKTTFKKAGVDSEPLTEWQNDAQIWSIRTAGAAGGLGGSDQLVIRDATASRDVLSITKSTGSVTISNSGGGTGLQAAPAGTTLMLDQANGTSNFAYIRGNTTKCLAYGNASNALDGGLCYDAVQARAMGVITANAYRFVADLNGTLYAGDTSLTSIGNNVDGFTIGNTGTGQSTDAKALIRATNTGSYTGPADGTLNEYGVYVDQSPTSTGGYTLNNVAGYFKSANGTNNYALQTVGDIGFTTGATIKPFNGGSGTLTINVGGGTLNFCADSSCVASFGNLSSLSVGGAFSAGSGGVTGSWSTGALTTTGLVRHQFDGTHYIDISPKANHDTSIITSGGTIYFSSYGATNSVQIGGLGNLVVNSSSASSVTGTGNGVTTLSVSKTGTGQTSTAVVLDASASPTFTPASGVSLTGVKSYITASRSGGAGTLTNIAADFSATSGDASYALRTFDGNVQLNANSGNTGIGDSTPSNPLTVNGTISSTTAGGFCMDEARTVCMASNGGTGLQFRTNNVDNRLIIDNSGNATFSGNLTASAGQLTYGNQAGTVASVSGLSGTINSWAPTGISTASTIFITSATGAPIINGIQGGRAGRRIRIYNNSANSVVFTHNSGSASAGEALINSNARTTVTLTANAGCSIEYEYDAATAPGYWRQTSIMCSGLVIGGGADIAGNVVINSGSTVSVGSATTFSALVTINSGGLSITAGGAAIQGGLVASNGNITLGNSSDAVVFGNGPKGLNRYAGKHMEWSTDAMEYASFTSTTTAVFANEWSGVVAGTGAQITNSISTTNTGRPGVWDFSTGSTTSGNAAIFTNPTAIDFSIGDWTWAATLAFDAASVLNQDYIVMAGFSNTTSGSVGCYFYYDRIGSIFTPATPSSLGARCADGTTTAAVILDGTTNGGFATTSCAAPAAVTWPNTNVVRLEIVETGSSVAFKRNGVTCVTITGASVPGAGELTGTVLDIGKETGTTARHMYVDQTEFSVDLSAVRSP